MWFDSFEHGVKRLEGLISSADIIIACKDHMSHSVLKFLEWDKPTRTIAHDSPLLLLETIHILMKELGEVAILNNKKSGEIKDNNSL